MKTMISKIRNFSILIAIILLGVMIYEGNFKNNSHVWRNYKEPQMASYTSLEEDEKIIKELEDQTRYGSHKDLDPTFFVKPNIFQTIDR